MNKRKENNTMILSELIYPVYILYNYLKEQGLWDMKFSISHVPGLVQAATLVVDEENSSDWVRVVSFSFSAANTPEFPLLLGHGEDVTFSVTQYRLTANNIFSVTRGPSSWSMIFVFHLIPPTIFLTLTSTSAWSRIMTAPSGRKIRSISRRMSSALHLHKLHIDTGKP